MPTYADIQSPTESTNIPTDLNDNSEGSALKKLVHRLTNLGANLGYDISGKEPTANAELINIDTSLYVQFISPLKLLGVILTIPIDGNSTIQLNKYAGLLLNRSKSSASSGNTGDFVETTVNLIDQEPLQSDPVSQAVLNLVSTPDSKCDLYFKNDNGQKLSGTTGEQFNSLKANCETRSQELIPQNILGIAPTTGNNKTLGPYTFYLNDENLIAQLNSNTLISPLQYTAPKENEKPDLSKGLQAKNQQQEAINFIKYATAAVSPPDQPDYTKLATAFSDDPASFAKYIASLRTSAAQQSVGVANLNEMLASRMPQTDNKDNTSQALNEYIMATRRLNNQLINNDDSANLWIMKINKGSSATVQKEIAMLLAEINYQLYLSRKQQERALLTETMSLFVMAQLAGPKLAEPASSN